MQIIINKDIENIQEASDYLLDLRNLIGGITIDEIADGVTIDVKIISKE